MQAIGGVNEKIEGFYQVCKAKGLTGKQGVIIPVSNQKNLMLRQEVVESVKKGKFHIWAVKNIDEGIEILTGIPAGKPDKKGNYPENSVHRKVIDRRKLASCLPLRRERGRNNISLLGKIYIDPKQSFFIFFLSSPIKDCGNDSMREL